MARPRIELHEILVGILGSRNVYFQPPASIQMQYPCIVYEWNRNTTTHANNDNYNVLRDYQVTVIDRNPDSVIPDMVGALPYCSMSTTMIVDNLHHFVFNLSF